MQIITKKCFFRWHTPDSIKRKLLFNLQFLFTTHVVFFWLDKDGIFSSSGEIGKLPFLRTEDHPEITRGQKQSVLK